ncbi:hypothetical protein RugamoR64_38560 [Duganella rhizosphaerae]|uniref:hypothetical protein n=1 Tax=Duganella rhizosphaerae TaxID=2885763 RepID=UPI0030E8DEBB
MLEDPGKVHIKLEAKLVGLLTNPEAYKDEPPVSAPARRTAIVNDEMPGRIEIDCDTAKVVGLLTDNDAIGDARKRGVLYAPYCIWSPHDYVPANRITSIDDLTKPMVVARMRRYEEAVGPNEWLASAVF